MSEIITRRIHTRPNLTIDFYRPTEEIQSYIDRTYVQTGKRKSIAWTFSENQLTVTVESHWISEDAFREFLADPAIIESGKLMETYNTSQNIIQTVSKLPTQS